MKDVHQRYSHVKDYIHVTLIEVRFYAYFGGFFPYVIWHGFEPRVNSCMQANDILSSFDDRLRVYATKQLTKVKY